MIKAKISDIDWGDRARSDYSGVDELAASIKRLGLIQPIVLERDGDKFKLRTGGRRLTACALLGWMEIPYTEFTTLDPLHAKEVELEENIRRKDLTWQETSLLTKQITELKKQMHGEQWHVNDTAEYTNRDKTSIFHDINLANGMEEFPELKTVEDRNSAISKLKRLKDAKRRALLVDQEEQDVEFLFHLPAEQLLKRLDDGSVDLMLLDPPYGLGIDKEMRSADGDYRENWHQMFDDTTASAMKLMEVLLEETSRVLREGAHCYLFFGLNVERESEWGISKMIQKYLNHQKQPLLWVKTTHSNKEPYSRFAINYEPIYWCWKGAKPNPLTKPHFASRGSTR